ncbi:MAG TPA: hypothetical protein VFE05_00485 [Longimicrobiaceae bacterium]|nr:hypothetical protein [Longimicrobiaceae bacterium]
MRPIPRISISRRAVAALARAIRPMRPNASVETPPQHRAAAEASTTPAVRPFSRLRERVAALRPPGEGLLLLLLAACHHEGAAVKASRSIALPAAVHAGAGLRIDGRGRAWIVEPGRATVVDTTPNRPPSTMTVGKGVPIPAPLWDVTGRLYADSGSAAVSLLEAATGHAGRERNWRPAGPLARDPKGRWIYAAVRHGGVMGLGPVQLLPRWGWPEAGPAATALAVSPLGDRVYLALAADTVEDADPAIRTLDAQSGRMLGTADEDLPVRFLAVGREETVFGYAEGGGKGSVFALKPGAGGLAERWRVSLRQLELEAPVRVRLSPRGTRLAVFSTAADGGGLRVLDAATGAVVSNAEKPPLDAAFDAGGRLLLLYPRELTLVR